MKLNRDKNFVRKKFSSMQKMTSTKIFRHFLHVNVSMFMLLISNHTVFSRLIKTIRKFSNVIGYQQPDLSINWTVAHVMLVIGQYAPFCARCCGALC